MWIDLESLFIFYAKLHMYMYFLGCFHQVLKTSKNIASHYFRALVKSNLKGFEYAL